MLTDQELQTLRNSGDEGQDAANEIGSLRVKLESALSHNSAEAEDADRYRWLRDKAQGKIVFDHTKGAKGGGSRFLLMVPFDGKRMDSYSEEAARIDASVDAELAKAAP